MNQSQRIALEQQLSDARAELRSCHARNAMQQNAIRVLVSAHQGDPWANRLGDALICLMDGYPEHQAELWLRKFGIMAREIVAQGEETERWRQIALLDPLTGLLNRRAFDMGFDLTIGLLRRESVPQPPNGTIERRSRPPAPVISLLVFDLDFFKRVNDTYGHGAGDTVLVKIAQLLREHLGHRQGDLITVWNDTESIARFGGEEFVVVLPRANTEHATGLASQFLSVLAETNISVTTNAGETIVINVTASCGISTIQVWTDTPVSVALTQADKALYQAKHSGRNRVVHYDEIGKE